MFPQTVSDHEMLAGKLFQMRGPATANDLSHSAVLVRGTSSVEVPADRMPGPTPTERVIPPGSVNEYQLKLGSKVNGHTTRCTGPVSVILQLRLASG